MLLVVVFFFSWEVAVVVYAVTGAWPVPLVGAEVKAVPETIIQSYTALKLQQDCRLITAAAFIIIIITSTLSIQGICCS